MKRKGLFAAVSFFVALAFAVRTAFFDANSVFADKGNPVVNSKNDYAIALDLNNTSAYNSSNPKTLVVKDTLAMARGLDVPSSIAYSNPTSSDSPAGPLVAAASSAWDSVSSAWNSSSWNSLLNFVADFFIPATPSVPSVTVNNNANPSAPSNTTNTTNVTVQSPTPSSSPLLSPTLPSSRTSPRCRITRESPRSN